MLPSAWRGDCMVASADGGITGRLLRAPLSRSQLRNRPLGSGEVDTRLGVTRSRARLSPIPVRSKVIALSLVVIGCTHTDTVSGDDSGAVVQRYITFWRNGFSIQGGLFYGYGNPENERLLAEINTGYDASLLRMHMLTHL